MTEENEFTEIEENNDDSDGIIPGEIEIPYNPTEIDIVSEQNSLATILDLIEDQAIDLNTAFQRNGNLWHKQTMSRLIESILLRLPLPAFYFDATDPDKWLIVDGLQRISTFKAFILDQTLILRNLQILTDLNGKSYEQLDKFFKRRMARYQLTTHLIKPGTPKKVKYDIFSRINTGGLVLTRQEIRHALNQGKTTDYLKALSENKKFKSKVNINDKRMQAQELVLRYLAFSMIHYTEYKPPFSSFLDTAIEKLHHSQELEQLELTLWRALDICQELFGKHIFSQSVAIRKLPKLNRPLFEIWTVLIGKLTKTEIEQLLTTKQDLIKDFKSSLRNKAFSQSISASTATKTAVHIRFKTIEDLINKHARPL